MMSWSRRVTLEIGPDGDLVIGILMEPELTDDELRRYLEQALAALNGQPIRHGSRVLIGQTSLDV